MTAPTMRLPRSMPCVCFWPPLRRSSFTQAAQEIHLTQGAVSRQIQTLEAFYRTPLFVREQRGLTLTAAGEALLPAVQQAFGLIREASEALARRESDIRVRVAPTPAMRWLLPNLPDFQTRHPEYTLHLITQLMHDTPFNAAEYDLAIVGLTEPSMPGLISECLARAAGAGMRARPAGAWPTARHPRRPAELRAVAPLAGTGLLGGDGVAAAGRCPPGGRQERHHLRHAGIRPACGGAPAWG